MSSDPEKMSSSILFPGVSNRMAHDWWCLIPFRCWAMSSDPEKMILSVLFLGVYNADLLPLLMDVQRPGEDEFFYLVSGDPEKMSSFTLFLVSCPIIFPPNAVPPPRHKEAPIQRGFWKKAMEMVPMGKSLQFRDEFPAIPKRRSATTVLSRRLIVTSDPEKKEAKLILTFMSYSKPSPPDAALPSRHKFRLALRSLEAVNSTFPPEKPPSKKESFIRSAADIIRTTSCTLPLNPQNTANVFEIPPWKPVIWGLKTKTEADIKGVNEGMSLQRVGASVWKVGDLPSKYFPFISKQ
ncbi:hypothetical protein BZA77DRAFT_289197 [Pyronema omphalodes]|nr:hypothetical protein BZA77DRAFT_289197 [Pyronema omphalodes]